MAATNKRKAAKPKPKRKPARKRTVTRKVKSKKPKPTSARTQPQRTSTPAHTTRARFTEPLRRAGEYENVRALIDGQAEKYGDRTFLIHEDDGREYSFARLGEVTNRVANLLTNQGATPGSRVAVLLENSPDFVFALLGAMKGGFIAVPLSPDTDTETVRFVLEDCGVNFVVTDADTWQRLQPIMQEMPGVEAVLVAGGKPAKGDGPRVLALHESLESAEVGPPDAPHPRWWDEAQIVYTGHDLDTPRGAILQQRQFLTAARWLSMWLGLGQNQRFMSVLPLFHTNAQVVSLFAPLTVGGSVVLSREFSVSRVWKAVERYRVTTLAAVPSMLGILVDRELSQARRRPAPPAPWPAALESPGAMAQREDTEAREQGLARAHDIGSLERVICSAAPLPAAVQRAFEKCFLVPVIEGFSTVETTGFASINPGNGTRRIGTAGVAVGDRVAIQDDRRPPRPLEEWHPTNLLRMSPAVFPTAEIGEPGEICVWGENVLKEYLHRPQLNPAAFAGGWYHTGEVGVLDCDGYLTVLGEKDAVIDLGAERLMPREIDELLYEHEKVECAATAGVQQAGGGSMVTTWVVMKKGTFEGGPQDGRLPAGDEQAAAAETEIVDYLSRRLPRQKRPSNVIFADAVPQDAAGRTRVFELRRILQRREEAANKGKGT